jgi:hypothetical protein
MPIRAATVRLSDILAHPEKGLLAENWLDPVQRQEIDLADESHRRDIMGFNDDRDSFDIMTGEFDDDDGYFPPDEDDEPDANSEYVMPPSYSRVIEGN